VAVILVNLPLISQSLPFAKSGNDTRCEEVEKSAAKCPPLPRLGAIPFIKYTHPLARINRERQGAGRWSGGRAPPSLRPLLASSWSRQLYVIGDK